MFFNKFYYNYRAIQSVVALSTKQYNTGKIMEKISSGRVFLKFEQVNSGSAVPMDMGWSNAGILITVFQGFCFLPSLAIHSQATFLCFYFNESWQCTMNCKEIKPKMCT